MEAWAVLVAPGALTALPGGDNPAFAVAGPAGHIRVCEDLIVIDLLLEAGCSPGHRAVLYPQIGKPRKPTLSSRLTSTCRVFSSLT